MELTGVYHPMDGSTTKLEHLKAIEVKCEVIDENVHKVLQFLCTFNFCKWTAHTFDSIHIAEQQQQQQQSI